MTTGTVTAEEVVPSRADLVAAWATVRNDTIIEVDPEDPPAPVEELELLLRSRTTERHVRCWVAFVDGEPVGEASFELDDNEENGHIASSDWLAVRRPWRRRGVADALVDRALSALADDGRTVLQLWAPELDPDVGRDYAERLGLAQTMVERCSRLALRDLDDDLVDRWCRAGRDRADGYRLVQFGDTCPDEHLGAYLDAVAAMDDMPTDDMAWSVVPTDEELARSREAHWRESRHTVARSLVLAPDGRGAGFSELFVSGHRPSLAWQGDTGVVPAHRGHGLGRWLKAENLRYAQRLVPDVEVVQTYNAESNPWMLDINVAMGFRPHVAYRCFEGDLARARHEVRSRGV